jgi:hypothetical protein
MLCAISIQGRILKLAYAMTTETITSSKLRGYLLQLTSANPKKNYLFSYNMMRFKRFLIKTLVLFFIQYLSISSLNFSYPGVPIYLPIANAFLLFYFLGNTAFLGLLLGGLSAYALKGLPTMMILQNLTADISGGYFGAFLCRNVFSSDVKPFSNAKETIFFLSINAFITCPLSGLIRVITLKWGYNASSSFDKLLYQLANIEIASLNAILILSYFTFTWYCVPFSREKVSNNSINKFPMVVFALFMVGMILLLKHRESIYILIIGMFLFIYAAYYYGCFIGSLLLFIISNLYLVYFIIHQQYYLKHLGPKLYLFVSIFILLYALCLLYISQLKEKVP